MYLTPPIPFLTLKTPKNLPRTLDLKETGVNMSYTFFFPEAVTVFEIDGLDRSRGGLLVSICRSLTPVVCVRFRPCMCVFETMLVMLCLQVLLCNFGPLCVRARSWIFLLRFFCVQVPLYSEQTLARFVAENLRFGLRWESLFLGSCCG